MYPLPIFGFTAIDWVGLPVPAISSSGNYTINLIYPTVNGKPTPYVNMLWVDLSTGAEVVVGTNLSAESVRVYMIGG